MQHRDGLQEVGVLHALEDRLLRQALVARGHLALHAAKPVVAEVVTIGRIGGSDQLKHRQRHAAGVDLLEYQADRLLAGLLLQYDQRDLVLVVRVEHLFLEVEELRHCCGVVLVQVLEPVHGLQDLRTGKVQLLTFQFARG